jgi:hypothetical protein
MTQVIKNNCSLGSVGREANERVQTRDLAVLSSV